jgi:uncharacterized membrane protein
MKAIKTILAIIALLAVFALIGTAGALEQDTIDITQCLVQSAISIGVMGISVYALNQLDE